MMPARLLNMTIDVLYPQKLLYPKTNFWLCPCTKTVFSMEWIKQREDVNMLVIWSVYDAPRMLQVMRSMNAWFERRLITGC